LIDQGRLGDPASRHGGAYVFAYHPFPGGERERELEDALVTVTPSTATTCASSWRA
jgi:hypothetical protein